MARVKEKESLLNYIKTAFSALANDDLEEIVNCAQCGKELKYGDCYTSLEIHTDMGMGFAVCEDCYEEEWQRRKKEDRK